MPKELTTLIAIALGVVAYYSYFRDVLAHKTRPHPYSWFVWGLTSGLIFVQQLAGGAGVGAYTTASITVISLAVCGLSVKLTRRADITRTDTLVLAAALLATVLWLAAEQPVIAMILLVSAEMLGFIPSFRKAWRKPKQETLSMWTLNGLRHGITLFALESYNLVTVLNPAAWATANLSFACMLVIRRHKLRSRW